MKSEFEEDRDPVEFLAAEFVEQHRSGQNPSIAAYAAKYPEWSEAIRDLFPAVLAMERLKSNSDHPRATPVSLGARKLERLGDFRLLHEIGRGGMGVVYEALHESLGRHVAVKVLPQQTSRQHGIAFLREARTVARLHHSHIVPLFGVGEHDGYQYIVMQLIQGVDLDAILSGLRMLHAASGGDSHADAELTPPSPTPGSSQDSVKLARALLGPGSSRRADLVSVFGRFPEETTSSGPGSLSDGRDSTSWADESVPVEPSGIGEQHTFSSGRLGAMHGLSFGEPYWRRIAAIGRQAADALDYAHRHRTLHRDIKPANLILDASGVVWITDFGLAKAMDESQGSQANSLAGTLRFMAPEQFAGKCDHRSDIYSLGLTLYELLTLQPAYYDSSRGNLIRKITESRPTPIRECVSRVPRDLEAIVHKAIARDPDQRYGTAQQFARDLQYFLEDRPVSARPTPALVRGWRWARRNRSIAAFGSAAAIFLLTTAIFASAQYVQRSRALQIESQLREHAETQRLRTEGNLRLAGKAFDEVFTRVTGNSAATTLDGRSDDSPSDSSGIALLSDHDAAILEGLLLFYDEFARENEDDLRWQNETARAFSRAGEIQFRLGKNQEAHDSLRRSLTILEKLATRDPRDADLHTRLAATRVRLANIAWESGEGGVAVAESGQAWQELLRHPAILDNSPACRLELARAYNQYAIASPPFRSPGRNNAGGSGKGSRSGRSRTDPREYLQRAIGIVDALLQNEPDNLNYSLTMAESYRCLWWLETMRQEKESAQRARREAIRLLTEAIVEFPQEPDCKYLLAEIYILPVRFSPPETPIDEATSRQIEQARALAIGLNEKYPQVARYQPTLARAHAAAARVAAASGDRDRALELNQDAMVLRRSLAERSPTRGWSHAELIRVLEERVAFLKSSDAEQRRVALEELAQQLDALPDSWRRFPPFVSSKIDAYDELAKLYQEIGEPQRGREMEEKAAEARAERRPPRSPGHR